MSNKLREDYEEAFGLPTVSTSSSSEPPSTLKLADDSVETLRKYEEDMMEEIPSLSHAKLKKYSRADSWSNWAEAPPLKPPASEYIKVRGDDVRAGDHVQYEVDEDGSVISGWGLEIISIDGKLGYRDRWDGRFRDKSHLFTSKRYYTVRTPRPQPPSNEFGPVHP